MCPVRTGAHPRRQRRGQRATRLAHRSATASALSRRARLCGAHRNASAAPCVSGRASERRVQGPAPGTNSPPPPPPAPAPPGSRGRGKGQSPPLRCSQRRGNGTYNALRCHPPPPLTAPRDPPTERAARPRWSAVRGRTALHSPAAENKM